MTLMDTIHEIKLDSIFSSPESLPSLSLHLRLRGKIATNLQLISSSWSAFPPANFQSGDCTTGLERSKKLRGSGPKYELWEPLGWPRTQAAASRVHCSYYLNPTPLSLLATRWWWQMILRFVCSFSMGTMLCSGEDDIGRIYTNHGKHVELLLKVEGV